MTSSDQPGRRRRGALLAFIFVPALLAGTLVFALTGSGDTDGSPPEVASKAASSPDPNRPDVIVSLPGAANKELASAAYRLSAKPPVKNPEVIAGSAPRPARPVNLAVPSLGIETRLQPVGATKKGIEVPPTDRAGWFRDGPRPAEPGRTVVIGHRDGVEGAAVFASLSEIKPKARIVVTSADTTRHAYVVVRSISVPKNAYPAASVHRTSRKSTLVLITCGGVFDEDAASYRDSIIVFARAA